MSRRSHFIETLQLQTSTHLPLELNFDGCLIWVVGTHSIKAFYCMYCTVCMLQYFSLNLSKRYVLQTRLNYTVQHWKFFCHDSSYVIDSILKRHAVSLLKWTQINSDKAWLSTLSFTLLQFSVWFPLFSSCFYHVTCAWFFWPSCCRLGHKRWIGSNKRHYCCMIKKNPVKFKQYAQPETKEIAKVSLCSTELFELFFEILRFLVDHNFDSSLLDEYNLLN